MWWQRAVVYEIYIRSFQDSNDDGIGDLNGITSRLDYLADLGVDAIWITPFYPSPQVDFGYDVSNHEDVDPQFGTLADFDRLVAEAHARGLRIILDLVLNHTSEQHPWFADSRASRTSTCRDWYIWRDGAGGGRPPNNWESAFGGPAWTFDEATGQWYYHFFYAAQPDLNWRNPLVAERMFRVLRFWLDRGVDGFRLDAVNTLFEDPELRDNPVLPEPKVTLIGVRTQEFVQTRRLPEVHDALRRLRGFVDAHAPETVLMSEAYVDDVAELIRFYGEGDEMHLPFNFFLAQVPSLGAAAFRRVVEELEAGCAAGRGRWPSLVLNNHDIDRACDRYATDGDTDAVAKLLAMLLLTLRGTPVMYYGEEIGMRTHPPSRIDEVRDPVGRTFWPRYKGRDGTRRPMPWTAAAGAGFSGATPWLPLPPDTASRNVDAQEASRDSILNFYRALTRLRRNLVPLHAGAYRGVGAGPNVFAFVRDSRDASAVVILNMAASEVDARIDRADPVADGRWRVALGTRRQHGGAIDLRELRLEGNEGVILTRDA
jgi:alpha-glucosidase